jgi:hypothetical protein
VSNYDERTERILSLTGKRDRLFADRDALMQLGVRRSTARCLFNVIARADERAPEGGSKERMPRSADEHDEAKRG